MGGRGRSQIWTVEGAWNLCLNHPATCPTNGGKLRSFQVPAETAVVQQRDEVEEEPAPAGAGQVELTGRRH